MGLAEYAENAVPPAPCVLLHRTPQARIAKTRAGDGDKHQAWYHGFDWRLSRGEGLMTDLADPGNRRMRMQMRTQTPGRGNPRQPLVIRGSCCCCKAR